VRINIFFSAILLEEKKDFFKNKLLSAQTKIYLLDLAQHCLSGGVLGIWVQLLAIALKHIQVGT